MATLEGQTLCPYDPSHVVSNLRAIPHLTKCRQSHPQMREIVGICPYNQGHHIPAKEMTEHLKSCLDYQSLQPLAPQKPGKPSIPPQTKTATKDARNVTDDELAEWT